ncbi:hypothetical protein B4N84_14665 [Flavobacterium sp. IR1]|nr:hypothetical protein B4N84_14665 [Flavobacterium sp. IR1]
MKKIFISILSIVALLTTTVSCTDQLEDINKNPNEPLVTEVTTAGLFNNANENLMTTSRDGFASGRMTLPWMQYSAQLAYTEEDRFQFREGTNQSLYLNYYLTAADYKTIIDLNTDPELKVKNSVYGNSTNQIAAARIMLAYTFSLLVDAYGDVPYYSYGNSDPDFQALQSTEYLKPKFASQEKIYTDILKELKEASESVVLTEAVFTEGDLLFKSPAKLVKFANSLRLRIATRVNGVVPGAQAHIDDAKTKVMTSNADSVGLTYQKDDVNPSPMYRAFFISNRTDFAMTNTFVSLLKGEDGPFGIVDPRLQKYAAPNTAAISAVKAATYAETDDLTKYVGMPYGLISAEATSQVKGSSFWSSNVLKQDYTEILMEYAEVEFLLAENNGWNSTNYINGITASMTRWGVTPAKMATYLASVPAATQETVLTQKYIALFMQPYEAYSEYRRTGFPNTLLLPGQSRPLNTPRPTGETTYTFVALNNLTRMPDRFTYPLNLQQLNGENVKAAAAAIGGDALDTKLIWAKK